MAEDVEVKLTSNDGSTKFAVQDSDGANVATIDSDGNLTLNGNATVEGGLIKRSANTGYLKLFGGVDSTGGGFVEAYGSGEATNPGVLKLGFGGGATTGNIQFLHYDGSGWNEKLRLFPSGGLFLGSSPADPGYGTFKATYGISASTGVFSSDVTIDGNIKTSGAAITISTHTIIGGKLRFNSYTSDPLNPVAGEVYYNSTTNRLRLYNGTWVDIATGTITGGGTSEWTDAGTIIYPTETTDDVAIDGTDSTAPFYFDSTNDKLFLNELTAKSGNAVLTISTETSISPALRVPEIKDENGNTRLRLSTSLTKPTTIYSQLMICNANTDPADAYIKSRAEVYIDLDDDGGSTGRFVIRRDDDSERLTLSETGNLWIYGDLDVDGADILNGGAQHLYLGDASAPAATMTGARGDFEVLNGNLYLTDDNNNRKIYWEGTGIAISTRVIVEGDFKVNKNITGIGGGNIYGDNTNHLTLYGGIGGYGTDSYLKLVSASGGNNIEVVLQGSSKLDIMQQGTWTRMARFYAGGGVTIGNTDYNPGSNNLAITGNITVPTGDGELNISTTTTINGHLNVGSNISFWYDTGDGKIGGGDLQIGSSWARRISEDATYGGISIPTNTLVGGQIRSTGDVIVRVDMDESGTEALKLFDSVNNEKFRVDEDGKIYPGSTSGINTNRYIFDDPTNYATRFSSHVIVDGYILIRNLTTAQHLGYSDVDSDSTSQPTWLNNTTAADFWWQRYRTFVNATDFHPTGRIQMKVCILARSDYEQDLRYTLRDANTNTFGNWNSPQGSAGASGTNGSWFEGPWSDFQWTDGPHEIRLSVYTTDSSKYYYIYKAVIYIRPQQTF